MTAVRTFPIRLAPLPGEALDSWLEALAHRLSVGLGDVLDDLELAAPFQHGIREIAVPTDWTIALREEEAARIAHATGTDPQQLRDMTLMRFHGWHCGSIRKIGRSAGISCGRGPGDPGSAPNAWPTAAAGGR
jgi:hypothetical protein